jgi:hypothetical protein
MITEHSELRMAIVDLAEAVVRRSARESTALR